MITPVMKKDEGQIEKEEEEEEEEEEEDVQPQVAHPVGESTDVLFSHRQTEKP